MSLVTYHLSPMPTARDPLPANSTEMFDWWNQPKYQTKKIPKTKQNRIYYFCNPCNMLFDQSSPFHAVPGLGRWHQHANRQTLQLIDLISLRGDLVNT